MHFFILDSLWDLLYLWHALVTCLIILLFLGLSFYWIVSKIFLGRIKFLVIYTTISLFPRLDDLHMDDLLTFYHHMIVLSIHIINLPNIDAKQYILPSECIFTFNESRIFFTSTNYCIPYIFSTSFTSQNKCNFFSTIPMI